MNVSPLPMFPCYGLIATAAWLVPAHRRKEWKREWIAELWYCYRDLRTQGRNVFTSLWPLYRNAAGALRDGWWHFREEDERFVKLNNYLRSPRVCLGSLVLAIILFAFISDGLPATRTIFGGLPYTHNARIALITRTGRLSAVQRGIPQALAYKWKKETRLVDAMAFSSFVRRSEIKVNGKISQVRAIVASDNLFQVLGIRSIGAQMETHPASLPRVVVSNRFWREHFGGSQSMFGRTIAIGSHNAAIVAVVPDRSWFLSPSIDVYELNRALLPAAPIVVARCTRLATVDNLISDYTKFASRRETAFQPTAPHAMFLNEGLRQPLWVFGGACLLAVILIALVGRSQSLNAASFTKGPWRYWRFLVAKTALLLVLIMIVGLEMVIGNRQVMSDALGGPALLWFYIVACNAGLLAAMADQHARCRVCQRLLTFPIFIGSPGRVLLDWAGTELLCPSGHGALYVPHIAASWAHDDQWILLEQDAMATELATKA